MKVIEDNIAAIQAVAEALKGDLDKIVFVGGSTLQVYVDDEYRDDLRATKDVDFVVNEKNSAAFQQFEVDLLRKKFRPAQGRRDPKCRYLLGDIPVDIMPAIQIAGYLTNPWYAPAMDSVVQYRLPNGLEIKLLQAPFLLASKLAAFQSRGTQRGSFDENDKDLEDIVMLLNGRPAIVDEIKYGDAKVKQFVFGELGKLLKNPNFLEFVPRCFPALESDLRTDRVMKRIEKVIS